MLRASIWTDAAQALVMILMLGQTIVAGWYMKGIMPYQGWSLVDLDEVLHQPLLQTATQVLPYALQTSILILFGILFCWVSAGFWTAMAGFLVLLRGGDRPGHGRRGGLHRRRRADRRRRHPGRHHGFHQH